MKENIYESLIEASGFTSRADRARNSGQLPQGKLLSKMKETKQAAWMSMLGESFSQRTILVTEPKGEESLQPAEVSISGGWCAIRTKDVDNLDKGKIVDPVSGKISELVSVDQVVNFIVSGVCFDQIIDAIGTPSHPDLEFAAISESQLWSQRIQTKTEKVLKRPLSVREKYSIECAVEQAEIVRYLITERYLRMVTQNQGLKLARIPDYAITEELKLVRDELLNSVGLSLTSLKKKYPTESHSADGTSLVLTMYSQPYIELLRQKGYFSSSRKNALIAEPVTHAWGNTRLVSDIISAVHRNEGIYFEDGVNPKVGQIAYVESVTGNNKTTRRDLDCSQVINISNWEVLFSSGELTPDRNVFLNPAQNQLFVLRANLCPVGRVMEILQQLIEVQSSYKLEKEAVSAELDRETRTQMVQDVKQRLLQNVVMPLNAELWLLLKETLSTLTEGII